MMMMLWIKRIALLIEIQMYLSRRMTLICWDLSASLGPKNSLNEKYIKKSERNLKQENSTKKQLGPGWSPMGYWGEGRAGDWSSASKPAPRTILST